jgi:hypothetical protein
MENTESETEAERSEIDNLVSVQHVRIPAPLLHQLQDLLEEPSFRFKSLEHVIVSGLWSFATLKMHQLRRLREDAEGLQ